MRGFTVLIYDLTNTFLVPHGHSLPVNEMYHIAHMVDEELIH